MIPETDPLPALAKFELQSELGHGGMATVYRAIDLRLGRQVAVKIIHRHLRQSVEIAQRFTREARAVAKLRHRNIVEVFDVSDEDERERYLVVELIEGQSLRELLSERGALPVEVAMTVAREIALALEHAHLQGVVHRDIKPENVLLGCDPTAGPSALKIKLTDFGIAKILDAQGVTSTGQVLGSPAHMAPEQIEGGEAGPSADLFSLGVLLYESLTGQLPFSGKNPAQVLRSVLDGSFEPPEKVNPKVGARWGAIVSRALAHLPSHRFQSARAFIEAIDAELLVLGIAATRASVAEYLTDAQGFVSAQERLTVKALVTAGSRARAAGDVTGSADHFNRALAYSPADSEILHQISRLGRRAKQRRWVRVVALTAATLGVAAALALFVRRMNWGVDVEQSTDPNQHAAAVKQLPVDARQLPVARAPEALGSPMTPKVVKAQPQRPNRLRPLPGVSATDPPAEEPQGEREVQVLVVGALGGSVRIDGQVTEWFGKTHKLSYGSHRFEFVPPDPVCCLGSERVVLVEAGEGRQIVRGQITFRDATLQVSTLVDERAMLTCPTIFTERLALPGERNVPMAQAELQARCTITPEAPFAAPTQRVVTLRAGRTALLTWP